MATVLKTYIEINGVDVSSRLVSWKCVETFGQEVRDVGVTFSKAIYTSIPTLTNGMTLYVKRGATTGQESWVFKGTIDTIQKLGATVMVKGLDQMINLVNKSVTYSYDGVAFPSTEAKGSDIATDLIETYGGMTASVVDTGSTLTLSKFICNGTDVFSRLQIIAQIYDYQIYYDPDDDKVHFEPKGYSSNTTTLQTGVNVTSIPKWSFDSTQLINKLIVKGATQEVEDIEQFDGDNTALQTFTLSKKPIVVQVFEVVAGNDVLKVPGVEDSTSGAYDYEVDKENSKIKCTANWTPATDTNNVKVQYTNSIPVPIQVEDTPSQTSYGVHQAEKFFSDIQTIADAESRGNAWIDKYKNPFISVKLKVVNDVDYEAGQMITVQDDTNNELREVVINKLTKEYPHNYDVIDAGDQDWRLSEWGTMTLERIRRLEEENQNNTDLIIAIKSFTDTKTLRSRYLELDSLAYTGVSDEIFMLGHPTYGVLGTQKLGGALTTTVARIIQNAKKYQEKFYDTDFYDSSNSNATWDTNLNKIIF